MTNSLPPDYWYYQEDQPEESSFRSWIARNKPLTMGVGIFLVCIVLATQLWPKTNEFAGSNTNKSSASNPAIDVPMPAGAIGGCEVPSGTSSELLGQAGVSDVLDLGGVRVITIVCAGREQRITQVIVNGTWQNKSATPVGVALER